MRYTEIIVVYGAEGAAEQVTVRATDYDPRDPRIRIERRTDITDAVQAMTMAHLLLTAEETLEGVSPQ